MLIRVNTVVRVPFLAGFPARLKSVDGLPEQQWGNGAVTVRLEVEGGVMAKDHGSSVKNDKQYEGLRKKGMSKERAAKIANTPDASKKGGKKSKKSN